MKEREVWKVIKRSEMPKDRKCVDNKWVFEIKRNGIFRARLVARGYTQIPGEDYNEIFAPVANDMSFRIMLVIKILKKFSTLLFDVETAFLMGVLEEEVYMTCPEGLECADDEVLYMLKATYGLTQAARQYYLTYQRSLEKIGFKQCPCDPCLFYKKDELGIAILLIYVDDNLMVGDEAALQQAVKDIKKEGYTITVSEDLRDYLSCEIAFNKEETKAWLGQPHMVKRIEKEFGDEVKGLSKFKTAGTPGEGLVRMTDPEYMLSPERHKRYRTGTGMLLFMIKHSRPDMANAIRELTKCLDAPSEASYKAMLRCIKYLLDSKHKGLKIEPLMDELHKWKLILFTDSDWAGDKENRRSVSGYMLFLCGVLISWKSKLQKTVSLSSSEAEFYSCAEGVREIPFVVQLLMFLEIPVSLPVQVYVDNIGAIFMSENASSSIRTRHMDTRYRFVEHYQKSGLVSVKFQNSENNLADGCTKNIKSEIQDKHTPMYLSEKKDM